MIPPHIVHKFEQTNKQTNEAAKEKASHNTDALAKKRTAEAMGAAEAVVPKRLRGDGDSARVLAREWRRRISHTVGWH